MYWIDIFNIKYFDATSKLEQALKFFTVNPARVLGLEGIKGTIGETADADLVVLDRDMRIISVMSKGKIAMADEKVMMKGKFEL